MATCIGRHEGHRRHEHVRGATVTDLSQLAPLFEAYAAQEEAEI
jgi:hypothetical protein